MTEAPVAPSNSGHRTCQPPFVSYRRFEPNPRFPLFDPEEPMFLSKFVSRQFSEEIWDEGPNVARQERYPLLLRLFETKANGRSVAALASLSGAPIRAEY